jgi:hypothetical protein
MENENLGTTEQTTQEPQQPEQAPEVLDLDSVDKFKWGGREWTPKDLNGAILMQSDYTRKTQALAEERKYYDNLKVDLDSVDKNPALVAEFKKVYPEKFHYLVDKWAPKPAQVGSSSIDPSIMEKLNKVDAIEQRILEREVQSINAELDAKFSTLSKKYPLADEEAVVSRAQAVLNKGERLNDQVWDSLWKQVHDRNKKLFDTQYSQMVKTQKSAGNKAKDMASGGGIPGQAPRNFKTIKEASEALRAEFEQ